MDDVAGDVARDRDGLEVLSLDECRRLLAEGEIGRVGFLSAGEPLVMPVNYRIYRGDVVFRTTLGEKLDAARNAKSVAFEIDGWNSESKTGWSVIVRGKSQDTDDEAEIAELNQLGLEPWANPVGRNHWVRIISDEITGRRIG